MDTMSNDEFNDQRPLTSAEIAEVMERDDQEQDVELDEGSLSAIEADEQMLKLHEACKGFAERFRSLNDEIETMRPYIITLKSKFKVRQGTSGIAILFPDLGYVYWSQYCDKVFNLSQKRVNELISTKDDPAPNEMKDKPNPEITHARWIALGKERAMAEMAAKGVDVKASAPLPEKKSAEPPAQQQVFTKAQRDNLVEMPHHKAGIAEEIISVLRDDKGMNSQDIAEIIEEMKKHNLPSVKPQKTRFTTAAA
jgi:hypothetical protein